MDILNFLTILKEKFYVVIALTVLGILIGFFAYFLLSPIYETNVTFMVLESKLLQGSMSVKGLDIDTYLNFVDNEFLYFDIYNKLNIHKKYGMDFEDFKRAFEVTTLEDSAVIKLTVTFQDSEVSYKIAKMLGDEALALNRNIINQEVHSGYQFSESQTEKTRKEMIMARENLGKFIQQYPIYKMAREIDILRNRIALEENGELTAFPPIESVNLVYRGASSWGITPKEFLSLARIESQIMQTKAKLKNEKADNVKNSLSHHLKILSLLLKEKKLKLKRLNERLEALENTYYPLKYLEYKKLQAKVGTSEDAYEEIYKSTLKSRITIVGKTKEMAVIARPLKPQKPIFPKLSITLIAGFFLGILAAFAYVSTVAFSRKLQDA